MIQKKRGSTVGLTSRRLKVRIAGIGSRQSPRLVLHSDVRKRKHNAVSGRKVTGNAHNLTGVGIGRTAEGRNRRFPQARDKRLVGGVSGQLFPSGIHGLVKSVLFHKRQQRNKSANILIVMAVRSKRRKRIVYVDVVMQRQSELLHVVRALHSSRRLARRLHRGKQQTNQNADDCDHNEEFNESKTVRFSPPPQFNMPRICLLLVKN